MSEVRHLVITGRVQGVAYRASLARAAQDLGASGWVRNRADGSVEALVSGTVKAIEDFVQACIKGPPGARVSAFEISDAKNPAEAGFVQRPTL